MGKNGEINNSQEDPASTPATGPHVGDKIAELPANTKMITLQGEQLYVTPDDTYYKRESDGTFTIVGLSGAAS